MQKFELPDNLKISIIITTYNGEEYIWETIESIRNQTWYDWELIIVDDGSTDNTESVVLAIRDDRIRFYKAGRIGINGIIKNIGLSKATGELIAFIDHDDLWAPDKLERQVMALREYPGAGFCLCNGYNFKRAEEPVSYLYQLREGCSYGNFFSAFFRSEMSPWTQALLLRRQCLNKAGVFNETNLFADPEFIVNLSLHFEAVMLYAPLFYHRLHDNSYSVINWIKCHEQGLAIIQRYKQNKQLPAIIARDALFRSHINFGEKYLLHKKTGKAIQQFFYAWRNKTNSLVPIKKMVKAMLYSFKFFPGQLN